MDEYFTSLYQRARERHPELIDVSTGILVSLDEQRHNEYRLSRTLDYVVLTATLPLAFGGAAICFTMLWGLVAEVSMRLARLDYLHIIARVPGLWFGILIGVFAAFTYFLVAPVLGKRMRSGSIYGDVIWSDLLFVLTAIVGVYISLGLTIVLVASKIQIQLSVLSILFRVWLVPLGLILAVAPFGIVFAGLVLLQRFRFKKTTTEQEVCDYLLSILELYPRMARPNLDPTFRRELANKIKKIAQAIRRLHFKSADQSEEWAADQMKLAANNLLVCISWLYVPQSSTAEAIRMRLVGFTNAFLTGQLHELPRRSLTEEDGFKIPKRKQRVIRTISVTLAVLAYCLIPIVIYFWLRNRIQPVAPPDSLLLLLYSLWIVIGLYAYLEQTSQNAGTAILDLVKSIIGR